MTERDNNMLTRDNILDIIDKYQEEMDDLERALEKITDDNVIDVVENRLYNLADNKFRHELQAVAWGLYPEMEERRFKKMSDRDKIVKTIKLLEVILDYQDEIDELNRDLEKITNDSMRQAGKDRLLWLAESKASCEADARTLAGMWVKYFEEKGRK